MIVEPKELLRSIIYLSMYLYLYINRCNCYLGYKFSWLLYGHSSNGAKKNYIKESYLALLNFLLSSLRFLLHRITHLFPIDTSKFSDISLLFNINCITEPYEMNLAIIIKLSLCIEKYLKKNIFIEF